MSLRLAAAILSTHLAASPHPPLFSPLPPPTSVPPLSLPSSSLSPLLTQPPPILGAAGPGASAPVALPPSPIDSQKLDAYRFDLLDRQRTLELKGVSPAAPIAREIQQELLRLPPGTGSPRPATR